MIQNNRNYTSPTLAEFISEPLGLSFREARRISSNKLTKTIIYPIAIATETARAILKTADMIGRSTYYI